MFFTVIMQPLLWWIKDLHIVSKLKKWYRSITSSARRCAASYLGIGGGRPESRRTNRGSAAQHANTRRRPAAVPSRSLTTQTVSVLFVDRNDSTHFRNSSGPTSLVSCAFCSAVNVFMLLLGRSKCKFRAINVNNKIRIVYVITACVMCAISRTESTCQTSLTYWYGKAQQTQIKIVFGQIYSRNAISWSRIWSRNHYIIFMHYATLKPGFH